jgi:hypothetical protein
MNLEKATPPFEQTKLLYPILKFSIPHRAEAQINSLKNKGYLITNDELAIVGKYETPASRHNTITGREVDVIGGTYVVYDARNGEPNYVAHYRRIDEKITIEGAAIFEYRASPNPDPFGSSLIDTVRTRIRVLHGGTAEGSASISRDEYDNPRTKEVLCENLPTDKDLEWEMNRIGTQIAIVAKTDKGYDVFKYSKLLLT